MSTEGHDCWEDCDEGPHGCVCGNDCKPIPARCKRCGWLLSDIDGHLDAMYEDHIADHPAEAWVDQQRDVWVLGDDELLHAHETAPFTREHVEKKYGPLVPVPTELRSTDTTNETGEDR